MTINVTKAQDEPQAPVKAYAITWKSVAAVERYALSRYRHWDQMLISILEQWIIKKLMIRFGEKSFRIVDIPSGYGRFTPILKTTTGKLINADLNLYALQYQRQHIKAPPPAVIANVFKLPFRDGSCDLVFNFRLIQHFVEPAKQQALLQELARVSRRYVLISVYHPRLFHRLTQIISRRPPRVHMINKREWKSLVHQNSLEVAYHRCVLPLLHAQHIYLLQKDAV
jgi:SAM-dependent methyltransferase